VKSRWLTILLALFACAAFVFAVQGGQWWVIGSEYAIGPFGSKHCIGDQCLPARLTWLGAGERFIRIGMATWAAGLISAFVLLVLSARVAAKAVPRLAAKTALVSIVTAAATGIAFFVLFPGNKYPAATIDRGVWAFAAAIVLGTAAAISVLRAKR
jgi:hypothetical protein